MKPDPPELEKTGPPSAKGSGNRILLSKPPGMFWIFIKALGVSLFRPGSLASPDPVQKAEFVLTGQALSKEKISRYRSVCGFERGLGKTADTVPAPFLQTLFVGLLGKYITSGFFPVTPLGLIHTRQFMELIRPVREQEVVDLSCRLQEMVPTEKGILSRFVLEVRSGEEPVWKGISEFLTRSGEKGRKRQGKEEIFMEPQTRIPVPLNTGRQYAGVSGDYNPHHLFRITARLFGFRQAIAHGMWTLARVTAELEKAFDMEKGFQVDAAFKRPVFLPACTALGYEHTAVPGEKGEQPGCRIRFELRDADRGLPHLKGCLFLPAGSGPG